MNPARVEEIYTQHIRPLSRTDRLRLIERLTRDLEESESHDTDRPKRNIMELHGLGKEIWVDVNPDTYVAALRQEWDREH